MIEHPEHILIVREPVQTKSTTEERFKFCVARVLLAFVPGPIEYFAIILAGLLRCASKPVGKVSTRA
jgi:hypothetical protein